MVTEIAIIIAVLALSFSVASLLRSLSARRSDLIVEIERIAPNGSTEVFRLNPDDEQSIRSFLRNANSPKHESAHARAQ